MVYQVEHPANFKCRTAVTTHTVMNIINHLKAEFGPEYDFEPERITEGGIEVTRWPGKTPGMYRSMRFGWYGYGSWPSIKRDQGELWVVEPEKIIWSPHNFEKECEHRWDTCYCVQNAGVWIGKRKKKWPVMKGALVIKANDEAPHWTKREMKLVKQIFADVGLV